MPMNWKSLLALSCILLAACENRQRRDGVRLAGGNPDAGKALIRSYGCGSCHTVPGVRGADAKVGPPLTSMASRSFIAGVLENNPSNMIRWIQDPPGVDEKTAMPNLGVSQAEARDMAAYLYTLR
jgi:cytochrome c2